jgi:hypothetical protein
MNVQYFGVRSSLLTIDARKRLTLLPPFIVTLPVQRLQWIASFLAMTGRGRNDHPLRHCEARSAVAIYVSK